jgi:hypothetical protein
MKRHLVKRGGVADVVRTQHTFPASQPSGSSNVQTRPCLGDRRRGYHDAMLTILLIVLLVLLLTGGIGYSRRGRRL